WRTMPPRPGPSSRSPRGRRASPTSPTRRTGGRSATRQRRCSTPRSASGPHWLPSRHRIIENRGRWKGPMNANKALWEKGDFTRIASTMRESGEALVGSLGITEGMKVLDLGCGDGTTAVPEAQLGAEVVGVDIAANLVAAGNARAEELGLANLSF